MKKATLEKIVEYASMPLHGTLSRKLRKDISCQINEARIHSNATIFSTYSTGCDPSCEQRHEGPLIQATFSPCFWKQREFSDR
jgi:hypothetical protein